MTDRHAGYVVVLAENIRDDDAQSIVAALCMVKGVLSVEPVISDPGISIATARAKGEVFEKFMSFAKDILK